MFDRLHKQFPHVIFQNCAGGGGRLDLGIMQPLSEHGTLRLDARSSRLEDSKRHDLDFAS